MPKTYYIKPGVKKKRAIRKGERILEKATGANVLKRVHTRKKADIVIGRTKRNTARSHAQFPGKGKEKIKMNMWPQYKQDKDLKKRLGQTAAHEFGHTFGLTHRKKKKSNLMGYASGTGLNKRQRRTVKKQKRS